MGRPGGFASPTDSADRSDPVRRAAVPTSGTRDRRTLGSDSESKSLTIPRSISFGGRIGGCERRLVEGVVETDLDGCRTLAVVPGGVFRGSADVEAAHIGGTVEGTLTALRLLTLRASGRIVSGTLSYGELEIVRGGMLIGAVRPLAEEAQ